MESELEYENVPTSLIFERVQNSPWKFIFSLQVRQKWKSSDIIEWVANRLLGIKNREFLRKKKFVFEISYKISE